MFRTYVKGFPHFPKPGIMYWDFTPLLKNPPARTAAVKAFVNHFRDKHITKVAAVEAKGFTMGSLVAAELDVPLVLIRKPGLIPGAVRSQSFIKEYGSATYEIKEDAFEEGDSVLIMYDIMAGPGATAAAITLITGCRASVGGCGFVIELAYLKGREQLPGIDIYSLVTISEKPDL